MSVYIVTKCVGKLLYDTVYFNVYIMSPNTQHDTITRTVRIKKESSLILESEAERSGLSVNALVSNLVDQYVISLRFFKSGEMISLSSDIIVGLLDTLSEEEISEFSYQMGSLRVKDDLMQRGIKVNYSSVLEYISQILGQAYGWFRYDNNENGFMDSLHLSHNYGYKWSVFISSFVSSIFVEVIGVKVNTGISANAVNFEINKKKSNIINNTASYQKRHECGHDFTGTRQWLETKTGNQMVTDTVILRVRSTGANCDHEILSKVKGKVNGGTLLVVIESKPFPWVICLL